LKLKKKLPRPEKARGISVAVVLIIAAFIEMYN
jgi:hypothetical protein